MNLDAKTSMDTLLQWGNIQITIHGLINAGIIVVVVILLLFTIKKGLDRISTLDVGKKYSLNRLINYGVWLFTIVILLQNFGLNLSVILAGSAALLVGIGLGLQNVFSDFFSGLVILLDSSVKVGDIINLGGMVCQVKEIKMRTTCVITRDDKIIILPNSQLTRQQLINWSHNTQVSRFDVSVGASYKADVETVCRLMIEAAKMQPEVLPHPNPFVRLNEFEAHAVHYTVYFWCNNLFRVENIKSDIRKNIFRLFKQNNIDIPLPQRVIHYAENNDKKNEI